MLRSYNQRKATRNQSTVDYSFDDIFVYGNRYLKGTFKNNSGGDLDVENGIMVTRDVASGELIPAIAGATLANIVGIIKVGTTFTLAHDDTLPVEYCVCGEVDAGLIVFPSTVTLQTTVGSKNLEDIITAIGIIPRPITELSAYDN